jgi:hypothetical protein
MGYKQIKQTCTECGRTRKFTKTEKHPLQEENNEINGYWELSPQTNKKCPLHNWK